VTLYLNTRSHPVGGAVVDPYVIRGDFTAKPLALASVPWTEVMSTSSGKNVVFVTHGFNVSYDDGVRSLGPLEAELGLGPNDLFVGVLWPGDFWIPVVNYPFEGTVAIDCGRRIAAFCKRFMPAAQSYSFISHSLGARLVLEAVANLDRARVVCLTAGAINRDCLDAEYASVRSRAASIAILASHSDWVLKVAYAVGDPISDLLHDDHRPFQSALGYDGPAVPGETPIVPPWQIPDGQDFGHHDYLPKPDTGPTGKSLEAAGFMARALRGERQTWP
jgi:hypothetical protein